MLAVPSAIVAAHAVEGSGPILIALACKGQSLWATRLAAKDDQWQCQEPGALCSAEDVNLAGVRCLIGDSYLPQTLRDKAEAQQISVIEPSFDAKHCLTAGRHMLAAGQTIEPNQLQPLYPRDAEAVRLFKQRQQEQRS